MTLPVACSGPIPIRADSFRAGSRSQRGLTSVPSILLVDNDHAYVRQIADRLRAAGYEVLTAAGAEAASRIALQQRPDLIVMDADLPGYTGLELHECLKFSGRSRDIPVIFLTRHDSPITRIVALRQGAYDFMTKLCNPQRLFAAIERVLACRSPSRRPEPRQSPSRTRTAARRRLPASVQLVLV